MGRLVHPASARLVATALAAALLCPLLSARSAAAQDTFAADTFVDSVGINIHLHYEGTVYRDNFDLIRSRLIELGTRHVRDGLIDTSWQGYYDHHKALAAAGIKGLFITSPGVSPATLQDYPARMAGAFEGYEAPNEYNWSGDPFWVSTLRASLTQLHALKSIPALAGFPVYGPSLTEQPAYAALGDISGLIDRGNLHNYFAGRNPGTPGWGADGYGSTDWNLRNIRPYSGGKPIVTTETGYSDNPAQSGYVPQSIVALYTPRVVLEQFRNGIARTYIYELCDPPSGGPDVGYGLLLRDGSPKASFTALKNLLSLLSDPGPQFPVQPIVTTLTGAGSDVRQVAFAKRDGSYYLALWIETASYNVNTGTAFVVAAQSVGVTLPATLQAVTSRQWNLDGTVTLTSLPVRAGAIPVNVSDRLTILELRNTSPIPPGNLHLRRSE